jgi:hypothetical protein
MTPNSPAIKIEMIERSVRCFVLGLCGLIPGIGLPLAVMALAESRRATRIGSGQWNAARRYQRWGVFCACLSFVLFLLEAVGVVAVYLIETTPD